MMSKMKFPAPPSAKKSVLRSASAYIAQDGDEELPSPLVGDEASVSPTGEVAEDIANIFIVDACDKDQ